MLNKNWHILDDIPTWPDVGSARAIEGFNSKNCGNCYKLTYKGIWVKITAISTAQGAHDFVVSKNTLNFLTGGKADALGSITVDYTSISC